ncbi:MAG: thioesterase domain-containing protein [Janthinobacterium lividum]
MRTLPDERADIVSAFTCIRNGSVAGSLFLIPGLGGNIEELRAFASLVEPDVSVYVQQTVAFDANHQDHRIEAIATSCVAGILAVQPDGDYALAGYSFGGLVAFEIARALVAQGRRPCFFGLIEACPDEGISARLLRRKVRGLFRTPVRKMPAKASMLLRDFSFRLRVRLGLSVQRNVQTDVAVAQVPDSKIMNKVALQNYRPSRAPLNMTFFGAKTRLAEFPANPAVVWRPLVHQLTVEQVLGDHHTIIRAHAPSLATAFAKHLRAALAEREA